jgi:hypothetical protein
MIKIDNYIQAKYRRTGNKGVYKGSEILAYLRQLILSDDPALKLQARQAIERTTPSLGRIPKLRIDQVHLVSKTSRLLA